MDKVKGNTGARQVARVATIMALNDIRNNELSYKKLKAKMIKLYGDRRIRLSEEIAEKDLEAFEERGYIRTIDEYGKIAIFERKNDDGELTDISNIVQSVFGILEPQVEEIENNPENVQIIQLTRDYFKSCIRN